MSKYAEIIERLEKAKAADGKIDWMIRDVVEGYDKTEGDYDSSGFRVWAWKDGKCFEIDHTCTSYTASIDAAIALVERMLPGEWVDFGGTAGEDGWECNIHTDYIEVQEHARTAPIAILLSLFKVLRAKEERS